MTIRRDWKLGGTESSYDGTGIQLLAGKVGGANYFQALGGHPQLLQDQVNMFTHLMFEERALLRAIKKQIARVVSGINLSHSTKSAQRSPASDWEKWKMGRRRKCLKRMERPIGIELTPEPWQGSI